MGAVLVLSQKLLTLQSVQCEYQHYNFDTLVTYNWWVKIYSLEVQNSWILTALPFHTTQQSPLNHKGVVIKHSYTNFEQFFLQGGY